MASLTLLLCLFMAHIVVVTLSDSDSCYAKNTYPYLLFGTKTPYSLVFKDLYTPFTQPECSPVMVWGVVRHGTRNPFSKELKSLHQLKKICNGILENEQSFQNVDLCLEDLLNLQNWTLSVQQNETSTLTQQGIAEMSQLGKRISKRYPTIFQAGFSPDKFEFQTSSSIRSWQSASAFLQGMFSMDENSTEAMSTINNTLLKSYKNCTIWKLQYGTDKNIAHILSRFYSKSVVKELVQNVSARLGYFFTLEPNQIFNMYQMCRYDRAFNQSPTFVSPWCAVFTEEQLQILEFKEDLHYYYKHSYGLPINLKIGCPLVQDLMTKLRHGISNPNAARNSFYFTNHGMFQRLLARLGFFKDKMPLTANNITSVNRKWRTSRIPFGANLMVELYKCKAPDNEEYKVIFNLNEQRLPIEGCEDGVCTWGVINNRYTNLTDISTCNLDDCYIGSGATITKASTCYIYIVLFALVMLVFFNAS